MQRNTTLVRTTCLKPFTDIAMTSQSSECHFARRESSAGQHQDMQKSGWRQTLPEEAQSPKKPRLIQCLPLNRRLGPQRYLAICKVVSRAAGLRQEECSLTTEVETGSKDTNEKHGLNRHEFSEYSDHLLPDPQKKTELWENNMFNLGKSLT